MNLLKPFSLSLLQTRHPVRQTAKSSASAHVAKLMAHVICLDHLLATSQIKDQAEITRTAGITRTRVTQIMNLTNLAPDFGTSFRNRASDALRARFA